jgi:hypothetical protein
VSEEDLADVEEEVLVAISTMSANLFGIAPALAMNWYSLAFDAWIRGKS